MNPTQRATHLRLTASMLAHVSDHPGHPPFIRAHIAAALLWLDATLPKLTGSGLTHHDCDRAHGLLLEAASGLGMGIATPDQSVGIDEEGDRWVACEVCTEPVRADSVCGRGDESLCGDCFGQRYVTFPPSASHGAA